MSPRKLLIATWYFPPCASVATHRMLSLARYLPNYGWDTIVVAPPHVHDEVTDPNLSELIPPGKNIIYPVPFNKGFIGKVDRKFFANNIWLLQAQNTCKKIIAEHKPTAILTSFPPYCIHHLGLWINKKFRLPWIADFRDPWFDLSIGAPKKQVYAKCEQKIVNRANLIVTTSPMYTEKLRSTYPEFASKIVTITNGYDPSNFPEHTAPPSRGRLLLMYTGELYIKRNPTGFLDALAELEVSSSLNSPNIQFHFIGRYNSNEYELPAEVKKRGLEHIVTIEGIKPYKECLQETAQADILVLIQTEGNVYSIPAKLFEYIGAKRPILALADPPGEIEWILKKSGALHRIAPVRDVAKIKQAIIELVAELQANTPIVAHGIAGSSLTRENMVRQFSEQLNGIVS